MAATIYRSAFSAHEKQDAIPAKVTTADNPALGDVRGFVLVKNTPVGDVLIVRIGDAQYATMSDFYPHNSGRK